MLVLLAMPLLAGCLGPDEPTLVVDGLFTRSEARHDPARGVYEVRIQGVLTNRGDEAARGIVVRFGMGDGCIDRPDLPGEVHVGSLAPGSRTNLRGSFEQGSSRLPREALWFEAVSGDARRVAARGCDAIAVEGAGGG